MSRTTLLWWGLRTGLPPPRECYASDELVEDDNDENDYDEKEKKIF